MNEIEYPAIYKNSKNEYYATMGISNPLSNDDFEKKIDMNNFFDNSFLGRSLEMKIDLFIWNIEGKFFHLNKYSNEKLVLYKNLYNGAGVNFSKLEVFLNNMD